MYKYLSIGSLKFSGLFATLSGAELAGRDGLKRIHPVIEDKFQICVRSFAGVHVGSDIPTSPIISEVSISVCAAFLCRAGSFGGHDCEVESWGGASDGESGGWWECGCWDPSSLSTNLVCCITISPGILLLGITCKVSRSPMRMLLIISQSSCDPANPNAAWLCREPPARFSGGNRGPCATTPNII